MKKWMMKYDEMGYPYFRKPPLNNHMQNRQCVLCQSAMIIHDTPHFHGRFGYSSSPKQMEAKTWLVKILQSYRSMVGYTYSKNWVHVYCHVCCNGCLQISIPPRSTSKCCVLKLQVSVSKTSINTKFPSLHRADLECSKKKKKQKNTPLYLTLVPGNKKNTWSKLLNHQGDPMVSHGIHRS